MTPLYHWTCSHSVPLIRADHTVRPHMGVSWWTDLGERTQRTRAAVGLSSHILGCDRMDYRCTAARPELLTPWDTWKRDYRLHPGHVELLEAAPGVDPLHWWVSSEPVVVRSVRRQGVPR